MRFALPILFLMLTWLHAAKPRCWRLGATAEPLTLHASGFRLLLVSAEHGGGVLKLRAGLQNISPGAARLPLLVEQQLVMLRSATEGPSVPCSDMGASWRGGLRELLRSGEAAFTDLMFPWSEKDLHGTLVLELGSHSPLKFRLDEAGTFTAPDLRRTEGRIMKLDAALEPLHAGNQHIRLHLGQMRCADGALTIEVGFINIARFPFMMERCPGGNEAMILGSDGHPLRLREVRGGIVQRIAPIGSWTPGDENRGILRFEMPHPHVASSLCFRFPGYPDLPLRWDEKKAVWDVDHASKQTEVMTTARWHTITEQKLFENVAAFWRDISRHVREGRFKQAQERFDFNQPCELFHQIEDISFDAFEIQPVAEQALSLEHGELRALALRLNYRLKGQHGGNGFYLGMLVRMSAAMDGGWRVKALRFSGGPPFWSRGYTRVLGTPHILVLHKDRPADVVDARQLAGAFEQAWSYLSNLRLPMSGTYVGFLCSDEGDFELLTGAESGGLSGAVPGVTIEEKGCLRTYNLAMYANRQGLRSHRLFSRSPHDQQAMIEHELVHLALGEWSRAWTPGWLAEGIAVYFSSEKFTQHAGSVMQAMRKGMNLEELTRHGTLRRENDVLALRFNRYMFSAYAVEWIAKTYGEKRLIEFYRAYADEYPDIWKRSSGGMDYDNEEGPAKQAARLELTERLLKKHLGVDLDYIESHVAAGVKR